jgi:hypothetical protein
MQVNLIHILIKKLHLIKILQNNFHKKEIKSDSHFTFWMARGIQVYIYNNMKGKYHGIFGLNIFT